MSNERDIYRQVASNEYLFNSFCNNPWNPIVINFSLPVNKGYNYLTRFSVKAMCSSEDFSLAPNFGPVRCGANLVFGNPANPLNVANNVVYTNATPDLQGIQCNDHCDWKGLLFLNQPGQGNSGVGQMTISFDQIALDPASNFIQVITVMARMHVISSESQISYLHL